MKNGISLFLSILLSVNGLAQNGYLGAKNSLEFELSTRPKFEKMHRLSPNETYRRTLNRFAYSSYAIGYSHTIDKKIEFNMKYRFVRSHVPMYNSLFLVQDTIYSYNSSEVISNTVLNFLEDPIVNLHFFSFNLKYYRLGSVAPLGKYIGLEFEYGQSKFLTTDDIYVGKGDVAKPNNALVVKQKIIEMHTVHVPRDLNARIGGLFLLVGRTYPINDFLLMTVGMRFPILRIVTVNNYSEFGIEAQKVEKFNYISSSSFESILSQSMSKYTRISLNAGIKYMF